MMAKPGLGQFWLEGHPPVLCSERINTSEKDILDMWQKDTLGTDH